MTSRPDELSADTSAEKLLAESIASVGEALKGLRYGSVLVTVHEGRVVQIDVTEKRRLKPN
jgi:hypothetical protein